MKVYAECPNEMSKGIGRVRDAIKRNAPTGVEFVGERQDADLVVHHVIGVGNLDTVPLHERIAQDGKPYAMIQYCYRTTENGGDPNYWEPLWQGATCVWSYYDLFRASMETPPDAFYYAPLGVDNAFKAQRGPVTKLFTVGTSGYIAETEGVLECYDALPRGGYQFHLGPNFNPGPHWASQFNLTDEQVARRWAECRYVAGLRRVEGFELPAAEGLCCGARPVMFDAPHYRAWFGDLAEYVPEGSREAVTECLRHVFAQDRPVTPAERAEAHARFDWTTLVQGFWERVL
jgi:hypothetical protein